MDADAVLHTSNQLVQTLQPLRGISSKTNLLLEDVSTLSKLLQRVRNSTFDRDLAPMYDPMWESLQTADQKITEVVTEFERRVITIRAEVAGHLRAVTEATGVTLDAGDRLDDGSEADLSPSRMVEAQFDAEVVAWESAPAESRDPFGVPEGGAQPGQASSSIMSRYFPGENSAYRLSHPEELSAVHEFFSDPTRREAAIVADSWAPAVCFVFGREGGVGKSELAKHYCYQYKSQYKFIAWINAADASTILASFKKCLSYIKKNHAAYFEKNFPVSASQRHIYDAALLSSVVIDFVVQWLESLVAPWLMVVDNMGNASELPEPINFGSGSGDENEERRVSVESRKPYMQARSLSSMVPRRCGPRIIGHILVTGKKDQRGNWLDIAPCKCYAADDEASVLPFTPTLSVQSIEQLFFSFLLENESSPAVASADAWAESGEAKRHRELLESDIIARGMDLVNALHANPLAVVQALAAIREVRLAYRLSRPKLQGGSELAADSAVPRQLALEAPPNVSDYLSWMQTFSQSAESSFRDMADYASSYKAVLTTIAVVMDKIPSIRVWSIRRSLEMLAFCSPYSVDMGLLQLFLRPPHTPLHVRVLGKWRLPNTGMSFSLSVKLQEAEFEFEIESVFPLTMQNKTKRFKMRVFRNYAKIREAHDAMTKLYCPAASKLRFPSAILSVPTDGNAEDVVTVRRAELATFFKELSRCPCWGLLCTSSALHSLFGIAPASTSELITKVGTDSLYYPCDPLKVYMDCNPEFLRLASPLMSLSLLSVTHCEILVPTEDSAPTGNPFLSTFGLGEQAAHDKYNRRLEGCMNKCTQAALQMWLSIEGRYEAALRDTVSFLNALLVASTAAVKAAEMGNKGKPRLGAPKVAAAADALASKADRAVCEAEYIDNSVLPHALYVVLETPTEGAEFLSLARECFERAVSMPTLYDKAELCCQRCLDIIDKRGSEVPDGAGSVLEASWYVRYADVLYLTSRQDKARALFEHALKVYRKAPPGRSDVAGVLSILKKLGRAYFEDGRFKQAERVMEESIDLSRVVNAQDPEQLAIDLSNYATVMSSAATDLQRIQHCLSIKKEELDILKGVFGDKSMDYARCANSIGELEKRAGKPAAAKEWFEKSLDVFVSFGGGNHADTTAPLYNMGLLSHADGELDRARRLYEKALDIDAQHFGKRHLGAANMHDSLGILLCDLGLYDEGLDHLRAACDLYESFCGMGSRDTILSLNSLGYAYMKMNEITLGINVYEKSLAALRERNNKGDDDVTAQTLNALGEAHVALGRLVEARQLFMECYGLRISALGDKHPDTASVMKNLATVAFANNSFTEAREMALGALKIYRAAYGSSSTHEAIIPVLSDLGEIYHKLGKVFEANEYFEEALCARRQTHNKNSDAKLGALLMSYGKSLFESSAYAESSRKFSEALGVLRGHYGPHGGHAVVADCMFEFAEVKRTMGLISEAQELMEECLAMRHSLFGEQSEPVAAALMQLCDILKQQKDLDAALDAAEECARIRAQLYGVTDNLLVASSLQTVAKITLMKGRGEEALAIYRDVFAMLESIMGENSDAELTKKLSKGGELRAVGTRMSSVMHHIASILAEKECFVEATALFERCLDLRRRLFGEEHGEVASTLHCIADISYRRGLFEEALEIHSIGHAIRQQCFGEEDALTAASECYVAISELALGRAEKARDRLEKCVHRLRNRFGDSSVYVATGLHYMSKSFFATKDYDSTIIVEEKALDILLEVEGRSSGYVVDALSCIGDAHRAQNNASAAKKQYAKALEIMKLLDKQAGAAKLSSSVPSSSRGMSGFRDLSSRGAQGGRSVSRIDGFSASSLEQCKGGDDAISFNGALEPREKSVGRLLALYERMLWALDSLRSAVEADSFAEEALDMYTATFGINSAQIVPLLRMLGLRQRHKGDYSGAIPFLEKAFSIQESSIDSWAEGDAEDEAVRRQRCFFVDEAIQNINDISWLFDKQGMGSDAAALRRKLTKYSGILASLRSSGHGGVFKAPSAAVEAAASSGALFSYATSERQKESEKAEEGGGGAYSLLSNLSLFLSNKTE